MEIESPKFLRFDAGIVFFSLDIDLLQTSDEYCIHLGHAFPIEEHEKDLQVWPETHLKA